MRKYAEGDLGAEKSFTFRGPQGRLNLRAQNLQMFLLIGDGVDAETWFHHLRRGDYSQWSREVIKRRRSSRPSSPRSNARRRAIGTPPRAAPP